MRKLSRQLSVPQNRDVPVLVYMLAVTAALAGAHCRNNGNVAGSRLTADSVRAYER